MTDGKPTMPERVVVLRILEQALFEKLMTEANSPVLIPPDYFHAARVYGMTKAVEGIYYFQNYRVDMGVE